jgi:GH24 family phage-related lysozyme (muramidase)
MLLELSLQELRRWEWFRSTPYPDHKQCSIGYGSYSPSKSKNGKLQCLPNHITREEAEKRLTKSVQWRVEKVSKDFPKLPVKKQAVLVSFLYNCPSGYEDILKRWIDKHQYWCKKAGWQVLPGLVKRRDHEAKILFSE